MNRFQPGDTFDGNIDGVQNASADGVACGPTNPACPAPVVVGNNRFGRVFIPLPDVNASFDAIIAQLTRRFSNGLSFSALYTFSHTIDTSSYEIGSQQTDPSNQAINKGNSDYDVRHNFQLSAFYELPFFRGRHDLLGTVVGGWTIGGILDKHTGFPFTALIGACNPSRDRNGDGFCPDMPMSYTGGKIANPSKQDWQNGVFPNPATSFPGATNPVTPGTFGTSLPALGMRTLISLSARISDSRHREFWASTRASSYALTFSTLSIFSTCNRWLPPLVRRILPIPVNLAVLWMDSPVASSSFRRGLVSNRAISQRRGILRLYTFHHRHRAKHFGYKCLLGLVRQEVPGNLVESGHLHGRQHFGIPHESIPYELGALIFCH